MINVYVVPLRVSKDGYGGNIMFMTLPSTTGRTYIYENTEYPAQLKLPPSRRKLGWFEFKPDEDTIRHWCYTYFKDCPRHPAIIKLDLVNHTQELLMDNYIEDFVADNYDKIMERLNESGNGNKSHI